MLLASTSSKAIPGRDTENSLNGCLLVNIAFPLPPGDKSDYLKSEFFDTYLSYVDTGTFSCHTYFTHSTHVYVAANSCPMQIHTFRLSIYIFRTIECVLSLLSPVFHFK